MHRAGTRGWLRAFFVVSLLSGAARASADPPLDDERVAVDARLARDPHDVGALLLRSELSMRAGHPADALDDLGLARALSPRSPEVALAHGSVLHRLERDEEALAWLERAVQGTGATRARGLALRARSLSALGRAAEAIEAYDEALALADDPDLALERGALLARLGRHDEAARGYAEAALGADALAIAGIEHALSTGRHREALASIDALLPRMQARARGLLWRARALDGLGRAADARAARTEALAELERRMTRRPTPALRVDRAEALLGLGRAAEALVDAEAAAARAPTYGPAVAMLARARRAAGGAR